MLMFNKFFKFIIAFSLLVSPAFSAGLSNSVSPQMGGGIDYQFDGGVPSVVPGWVLPGASVDLNFATGQIFGCATLSSCLSIANPATRYCTDSSGVLHSIAPNTLAICSGTGLQIYSNQNLLTQSIGFSISSIGGSGGTVTNNFAAGPDGSLTASRYQWTTTSSFWNSSLGALTAGTYTMTVYAKINSTGAGFNFTYTDNTNTASTVWSSSLGFSSSSGAGNASLPANTLSTPLGNGWFRLSFSTTFSGPVASSGHFSIFPMASPADLLFWGAQIEPASFPGPYTPTTTAAVTSTDNVTATGALATTLSGSAMSAVAQTNVIQSAGRILGKTTSSTGYLIANSATVSLSSFDNAGTNLNATIGSGGFSSGLVKSGFSGNVSGQSLVGNNGTVVTTATALSPIPAFNVGSANSANYIGGTIQRLTVFNSRLPDATLKALTQ